MRVHELAKKLKITSKDLIQELSRLKIPVKGHMSVLDEKAVERIKQKRAGAVPKTVHEGKVKKKEKEKPGPEAKTKPKPEPKAPAAPAPTKSPPTKPHPTTEIKEPPSKKQKFTIE